MPQLVNTGREIPDTEKEKSELLNLGCLPPCSCPELRNTLACTVFSPAVKYSLS